jgi:anthranilate synthase component 1
MFKPLSPEAFCILSKTARYVMVSREIMADRLTPVGVAEQLSDEMREGVILERVSEQDDATEHYSLIAFGVMAQLTAEQGQVRQRIGDQETICCEHPFTVLRKLMADLNCAAQPHMPCLVNGAMGFCTYDAIRLFESIPDRHAADRELPEMQFNFYETTLLFDHQRHTLLICKVVETAGDPLQNYHDALGEIDALLGRISDFSGLKQTRSAKKTSDKPLKTDINDVEFMGLIERAKAHIIAGDAFQIVLSRRFQKQCSATPLDVYRALRRVSPAPYMFCLAVNHCIVVGASPEKFVSVQNGEVAINPIAGTRPRREKMNDQEIAFSLLSDEKECAEHMMLVDLARNDLGVVCQPGPIKIKSLLQVKHFSHVSHLASVITGQLREDQDAFDALAAAFPAGTLSGAPKIRAMQLIDELETSRRGLYGGMICRMDYQGNLDSCIAIRMAMLHDGLATVRTGAGIVYDSNPAAEARETRQKAQSVLDALSLAEEGLS